MPAISEVELDRVDRFLAAKKRLDGGPPDWKQPERPDDVVASWNVIDDLDIVQGYIRFRLSKLRPEYPSANLIFRNNAIWRVDLTPADQQKWNPPWATKYGLPASFKGSHSHEWAHNRSHIGQTGTWELPARNPVEPGLRRIKQMLPWIADRVGIVLEPSQRAFDAPPKASLFEE